MRALVAIVALSGAASAAAQQPAPAAPPALPGSTPEPKLMFDRETFSYPGSARRDPFRPLIGKESLGPLFDDLRLRGIIFSADPNRSLVLLQDGAKRIYRLHRGDVVGNSRVVEIKPLVVRLAVENLGMIRYEVLELRPAEPGAARMQTDTQPVAMSTTPATQRVELPVRDSATVTRYLDSLANERRANAAKQKINQDLEARR
jgi:hypothetical protein